MPSPAPSRRIHPDPPCGRFLVRPQLHVSEEPFRTESGGTLERLKIVYEAYGRLDARRANAILVFHGITGNAHAAGILSPEDKRGGWWRGMIGPGLAIDTERYFVICSNFLGGSGGTTGPASKDPATGRPYGLSFPFVTVADMVRVQKRLIDHLGIERLHAVIGPSTGGMQALQWPVLFPDAMERVISVAGTSRASAHTIAFNHAMREAIRADPNWNEGDYYDREPPSEGVANAILVGMLPWLTGTVLDLRGGRQPAPGHETPHFTLEDEFEIERFFTSRARSISRRIDANSLLYLTRALDLFDLSRGHDSLATAFSQTAARFQLVAYSSDWRYPAQESEEIADALAQAGRDCRYQLVETACGHSSFLLEWDKLTPLLRDFLEA